MRRHMLMINRVIQIEAHNVHFGKCTTYTCTTTTIQNNNINLSFYLERNTHTTIQYYILDLAPLHRDDVGG